MIEKLGTEEARYVSKPCEEMIEYLEKMLRKNPSQLTIAEVGVGKQVIDTNNKWGIFDLVYLDGAHSFLFSGLACALLKTLIREGGYLIFDDLNWSYGNSHDRNPKVYPEILEQYTQEQVALSRFKW